MATLSDSSKLMLVAGVFCLSLASASATAPCKKWPLLANYNITSKEFTCSGAISAFRLCSFHAYTHIGLTVWRRGKGTLDRRVEYANGGFDILHRDLTYERGDQLDYMVSYYYAENHNEGIGCHIPVVFTTTYGYNCTGRMPKLYLKVTEDCFHDIIATDTRKENRTRLNGESTNSSSTNTTSTTSSDSTNTTTISSRNATETTTSPTTSTPTLQGSTSTTVSSENASEASTTASTLTPTSAGTASYTKPHPAVKPEENSTTAANNNFTSQPQNSSSVCPNGGGVSKVTQILYGSSGSTIFIAMLAVIIILLVFIVLETVVCILVCIVCWRCSRRVREGDDDSNKPLKIGYKRTEEYDVALLEMDNPTESN